MLHIIPKPQGLLTALAFGTVILLLGASCLAAEIPKKIDEKIALKLVAEADGGNPSDFAYEGDDSEMSPPFFVYAGLSPPPAEGFFGYYAVNPWTGDVWDLWGCYKLVSEASRATQLDIYKRFTRKERKQYARLSRLSPKCTVLDELAEAGH